MSDFNSILSENEEILNAMKGCKIINIYRGLYGNPEKFLLKGMMEKHEVFSLGWGLLYLEMDNGSFIGFYDNDQLRSVVVIYYKDKNEALAKIDSNEEISLIKYGDTIYSDNRWDLLINNDVESVSIVKHKPEFNHSRFKNEVGLKIITENGAELVISVLLSSRFGHMVLINSNEIKEELFVDIEEVPLL